MNYRELPRCTEIEQALGGLREYNEWGGAVEQTCTPCARKVMTWVVAINGRAARRWTQIGPFL